MGATLLALSLGITCWVPPSREVSVLAFAYGASYEGNTAFLTGGILCLVALALRAGGKADLARLSATMLTETALVHVLKYATSPFLPRPSGGSGGFPSGHAAASWALAFLLAERFPRAGPLWYSIAGVISWSRVQVDDHYAYQVVGGAFLGVAVALFFRQRPHYSPAACPSARGSDPTATAPPGSSDST